MAVSHLTPDICAGFSGKKFCINCKTKRNVIPTMLNIIKA